MKTKFKSKLLGVLLVLVMVLAFVPVSALTAFAAGGTENIDFAITEKWGVYFEQTGSNKKYPIVLTNDNKLSTPLPTLYRTDSDDYVFDGWFIADTDTKVTQDTVFDGYTVVVDRWTYQEKDANTLITNITINNVDLEPGMTTAEYNAAVSGATATVNGVSANAVTSGSATTYTIYHGLNKSGDPLGAGEEIEVGQDYSIVTTIRLADGYTFDENITFISAEGMCASERFLGGADIYTKEWNTLANAVEVTINFRNTNYYFAQTPESRYLENYTQYRNWFQISKANGLESVTLQTEVDGQWAIFIENVPFEVDGEAAGGYVTVSPYLDTTKTFRLVANYTQGKVYSEPFEISWACLTPVIESVGIGITTPQSGYSPEYTATIGTSRCALKSENSATVKNGIKWTGESGELAVVDSKFDNENDYTVSIKLVARDGYTFANDVTAKVNTNNANVSVVNDTEIKITYTFPKPEKAKWHVSFNTVGVYATGEMTLKQIEEGEYTLPECEFVANSGYTFEGWLVNGLLKQPGDVITVTVNTYLEAKWRSTVDYNAPHGFTKQPADASGIVGMEIKYSVDNFTVDPSITYDNVIAKVYDPESGEWKTGIEEVISAGNGLVELYGQQYIIFYTSVVGDFTFRLEAISCSSTTVAISESFTVSVTAKKFTTQPQGDMVVVGDTVTVTAQKNFLVDKYEIEYYDGEWKLYQEVSGGWGQFSYNFTSAVAKSLTFRLKAYAVGDEYDEENDYFPVVLMDTSDEFTITWTSNEHVHTYGATLNGKDENNHWKECTDPACPDKAHSKIEVEAHKDNGTDNKCDVCGYDLPILGYTVKFDANGGTGTMTDETNQLDGYALPECGFTAPSGMKFKAWAVNGVNGDQYAVNDEFNVTDNVTFYAIWENIPVPTFTITATAGANGTISPSGEVTVAEGEDKTFTITANSGYHIKDVKVNGSSVGAVATYTFTDVAANATITVEFEVDTVPHVCNPTLVPEDEPDCSTAGKSAYYHCGCGKNYEDAQGNTEIENIETWGILNALNHEAKDTWSSDADNHWKECARCSGQQLEKAAHTDGDNNGKCDICEYQMSTTPDNPDNPNDTPDNPNNTPDNPNNTPDDPTDDKDGLGAGAIIGIVIGSVAVVGVGGFTLFWFVIKKKSFADLIAVFKK